MAVLLLFALQLRAPCSAAATAERTPEEVAKPAVASTDKDAPSTSSGRAWRIGWGCIELPLGAKVEITPTPIVDQLYGVVIASDKPRVEWSFGLSEAQPLCHSRCRREFLGKEKLGPETWRHGKIVERSGESALFVSQTTISFRTGDTSDAAREYLRDLATHYQRVEHPERCLTAE